jgi:hypothetical protein
MDSGLAWYGLHLALREDRVSANELSSAKRKGPSLPRRALLSARAGVLAPRPIPVFPAGGPRSSRRASSMRSTRDGRFKSPFSPACWRSGPTRRTGRRWRSGGHFRVKTQSAWIRRDPLRGNPWPLCRDSSRASNVTARRPLGRGRREMSESWQALLRTARRERPPTIIRLVRVAFRGKRRERSGAGSA